MNAVVVYESMFGNTQAVTRAVAEGLGGHTRVIPVDQLTDETLADCELLVIGGPTHAHGMSRHQTREAAEAQGGTIRSAAIGVREQLSQLAPRHISAAAFDTRIDKPKLLTGAASKGIAKSLRAKGYDLVVEPESFLVDDTKGPMLAGEIDRARAWGEALRAHLGEAITSGSDAGTVGSGTREPEQRSLR